LGEALQHHSNANLGEKTLKKSPSKEWVDGWVAKADNNFGYQKWT
jgi:hypothetical protein